MKFCIFVKNMILVGAILINILYAFGNSELSKIWWKFIYLKLDNFRTRDSILMVQPPKHSTQNALQEYTETGPKYRSKKIDLERLARGGMTMMITLFGVTRKL